MYSIYVYIDFPQSYYSVRECKKKENKTKKKIMLAHWWLRRRYLWLCMQYEEVWIEGWTGGWNGRVIEVEVWVCGVACWGGGADGVNKMRSVIVRKAHDAIHLPIDALRVKVFGTLWFLYNSLRFDMDTKTKFLRPIHSFVVRSCYCCCCCYCPESICLNNVVFILDKVCGLWRRQYQYFYAI